MEQRDSWLKRVAEQSWEPELLISGLAIYATSLVPDYLKGALSAYKYNFQSDTGFMDEMLPVMIVAVLSGAFILLNFTFVLHFVVRGFWVGLIGLNSVYTKGINFESEELSPLYVRFLRSKIGDPDVVAERMDGTASTIFSISFAIVYILFAIGLLYSLFFLLFNVIKLFIPSVYYDAYSVVIFSVFIISTLVFVVRVVYLNQKKFRQDPVKVKSYIRLNWRASKLIIPFVYEPIQFILMTFQSNMTKAQKRISGVLLPLTFFVLIITNMFSIMGLNMLEGRDFYAGRSESYVFQNEAYSSLMNDESVSEIPSISDPVINTGLVDLFIPYPMLLDNRLKGFCEELNTADSLSRFERRKALNEQKISCVNRFFSILLNEKDTLKTDLLFSEHPNTGRKGFRSFLFLPDTLMPGRHTLEIRRESINSQDLERDSLGRPLEFEYSIPFWYTKN